MVSFNLKNSNFVWFNVMHIFVVSLKKQIKNSMFLPERNPGRRGGAAKRWRAGEGLLPWQDGPEEAMKAGYCAVRGFTSQAFRKKGSMCWNSRMSSNTITVLKMLM